ncbi:hypothetical protein HYALB_00002121 [Hymenoscyphus albidus]|uniref:Uncharacterized protein n=1 Tax=Hymenoscyphus albidus TaxID=595503 RepID=A0A9N9Q6N4_9HELO|nr:hypothetical protein HYALB_00002121 [Hymenoscyphus albidus]
MRITSASDHDHDNSSTTGDHGHEAPSGQSKKGPQLPPGAFDPRKDKNYQETVKGNVPQQTHRNELLTSMNVDNGLTNGFGTWHSSTQYLSRPTPSVIIMTSQEERIKQNKEDEETQSIIDGIERETSFKPLKFLDVFPDLPSDSPKNHPRIIDVDSFREGTTKRELRVIDAAVTCLYNYDPQALSKFLDPRIEKFVFFRSLGSNLSMPFKLIRTKDIIEAGYLMEGSDASSQEWTDVCVRLRGSDDLREFHLLHTMTLWGFGEPKIKTQASLMIDDQLTLAQAMLFNGEWLKNGNVEFSVETGALGPFDMIETNLSRDARGVDAPIIAPRSATNLTGNGTNIFVIEGRSIGYGQDIHELAR